jgi:hypothetical protein
MAPTKEYALLCLENPLLGMSPNQLTHVVALEMRMQSVTLITFDDLSISIDTDELLSQIFKLKAMPHSSRNMVSSPTMPYSLKKSIWDSTKTS